MRLLLNWLLTALAFVLVARLLPGVHVDNLSTAFILALAWGIFAVSLRPILILLTLPVNLLTLGLFTFVINGFLFWLLSTFVDGFTVSGFGAALLGAITLSLVTWAINALTQKVRER